MSVSTGAVPASPGRPRETAALEARIRVRRPALTVEVELAVAAGETVAVMGPSGAGKSTLLGALAGLVPLTTGEIRVGGRTVDAAGVAGRDVHVAPMSRGVVLLGQDARLFPHLSARENVAFGPRAAGMARTHARSAAEAWLGRVGLGGLGDRMPAALSGGQQQRVAVARALAAGPRAVLLDEPLVGLDPQTAAGIRTMLREQLAGVTVVAVTHDAVDAAALGDRIVVLEDGRITQEGDVREVLARPATAFVASIAGRNRREGSARGGAWEGDGIRLEAVDAASRAAAAVDGTPLAAVFRPADLRRVAHPGRNTWDATVDRIEPTPEGVRVQAGGVAADLDIAAAADLAPGTALRLSVAPEDVRFVAGDGAGG